MTTQATTTQSRSSRFKRSPQQRVERVEDPAAKVIHHLSSVRGQFDLLSIRSDPAQISATDIIAVSMLGRSIPAASAAWLLGDEGQWLTAEILADVPPRARLQDCDPRSILRIADLFHLVRSSTSQTPARGKNSLGQAKNSLGQAKNSLGQASATRLLAAKRPALVPLDDRTIRKILGYGKDETWWLRWKTILDDELSDRARSIRSEAMKSNPAAANLSDLRIFDIVLRPQSVRTTAD